MMMSKKQKVSINKTKQWHECKKIQKYTLNQYILPTV